jgi:hypothetical protein
MSALLKDQEADVLWTAADIAEYLNVCTRQVSERYAMLPDFPKAIRLPSPKRRGLYRWKKHEVIAWVESLRQAA